MRRKLNQQRGFRRVAARQQFQALPSRIDRTGRSSAAGKTPGSGGDLILNNRLAFEVVCPHNHNQTVKFTRDEFEAVLKSGALVFHCNTCDTNWPPSSDEIAKFRKQFAADSR